MNNPRISGFVFVPETFLRIQQEEDHLLTLCQLAQETIVQQQLEHPMIDQATLTGMTFSADMFNRFELTDVVVRHCVLVNCEFPAANFYRVRFEDCKLVGTTLDRARLKEVTFSGCDLSLTNFNETKMTDVMFEQCKLTEANCMTSTLKKCQFKGCDLDQADFFETSLKGVDLSTCQFTTLRVLAPDIKGCQVNEQQAVLLAQELLGVGLA